MNNDHIVQELWNLCHILRGDGISYHGYISELTYLLFLKIAEENESEHLLLEGYRWRNLVNYNGNDLLFFYQSMLTHLRRMRNYRRSTRNIRLSHNTIFPLCQPQGRRRRNC